MFIYLLKKIFYLLLLLVIGYIIAYLYYVPQTYYNGHITSHFDGKTFFDPYYENKRERFALLKWKLIDRKSKAWPETVPIKSYDKPPASVAGSSIRVSMVGHATVLIQTNDLNILTDPVWSERASPFSFIGPKRVTPPGIKFEDLPNIDVILISHNHYEHLDLATLKQLWKKFRPIIIAPLGNDTIIKNFDPQIVVKTLDWEESISVGNNKFILEYARHWSARSLFDRNKALWGSFVISTPHHNIYFAGDTGYGNHFKKLQEKYGHFSLSLLPIGAYKPEWFMKYTHTSPEEAVRAHIDLNSMKSIALHHNTFKLSDEAIDEPASALKQALKSFGLTNNDFILLDAGEYLFNQ